MNFAEPLIIGSLSAILASIIAVIDSIVNNYGEIEIDINSGQKKLNVKGGYPLLRSLSNNGIFIPSACGGRGSCGACKVIVNSGGGELLPTEKPFLSADELKNNTRLSCQIKLKNNISISIPEELFSVKEFDCVIESIKDVTYDIKELRFKLNRPQTIDFKAGKYVQLVVPAYAKIKEPTQRAYSISSKPSDNNYIELLIRLVPGGIATTYVHNYLKENDKIKIIGPFGDFFMRETKADMICAAGGSGMAPIKSIIEDMFEKKIFDRNIWYFFGARSLKDLYYLEYFRELETKMPNLHFIPALSEPEASDNWQGETGLITRVIEKYLREKIDKNTEKEGYLCGSPGMLNACCQMMTKNGIKHDKIYFDSFA